MGSRTEVLLKALINGESVEHEPQSRIEKALVACLNKSGSGNLPEPQSRTETLLHLLAEDMANGGGANVEGTAIPVGEKVKKIYFNTNLSVKETNAYLSQLTYVQTDLLPYPICAIYARTADGVTGIFIIAVKVDEEWYELSVITDIVNKYAINIYSPQSLTENNNGWYYSSYGVGSNDNRLYIGGGNVVFDGTDGIALTDFNGLPIGAENEKIKNVLSITPFGVSGTSTSGATAHHLKSFDELPTNAPNGSIAIVDTPHPILGTWCFNSVIPNMPYRNWTMTFECDGTTYSGLAGYGSITYMTPTDDSISVYDNRWVDEKYKTITITKTAGIDETLVDWLTKNAARIETAISHAIYYRENGEWVYKGTTSEAISAEYY